MSSKYLNELFYHESDFSFDKIEPFFFTIEMNNSIKPLDLCISKLPPKEVGEQGHVNSASKPCNSVEDQTPTIEKEPIKSHIEDSIPVASPPCPPSPPPPPTQPVFAKPPFEPNRPDKLFWAIFTHVYGIEEYNSIGHSYGNRALDEKNKIGSHIKKNAAVFKTSSNYKITNIMIQEIQSELMTMHSKTSHIELIAMAFFYGIEIALCFENNTYMTFGKQQSPSGIKENENEVDPLCIIYVYGNSLKLEMNPSPAILTPRFKHHHYLKPLNTISTYKTDELYDIYHRLGMPVLSHKSKKQDIYHGIIEYLTK